MDLELTLSCGHYDLTQPMIDGTVKPEGIEWKIKTLPSPERHNRMLVNCEFDVCELSLSSYFIARARKMPLTAIPVFPHRRFRHGFIFINREAGIFKPADLIGKRIGIRRFQNTASVWVRGILADDYGVRRDSIRWFTEGQEELDIKLPPEISATRVSGGKLLDEMLLAAELDAVIYPETLPSLESSGKIGRLFPNYKQVEAEYFKRTSIFPIMHTVVIKSEILEQYPWVAQSVWRAFQQSKLACYRYLDDQRRSALVWFGEAWEEQRAIFGQDPWPYDMAHNRKAIETLVRYMCQDGLLTRVPNIEKEFVNAGA